MFVNLRKLLALMALVLSSHLSAAGGVPASNTTAASPQHRVVFAMTVNDPHIWNGMFGNFRNIQSALGPQNVDIEVVVYGDGIAMIRDDSLVADKVTQAIANGVKIFACENTLKSRQISRDEILPNIGYVPAGIVEIMKLQEAGWSYIKP